MSEVGLSHNLFQVPSGHSFRDAAAAIIFLDDGRYLMQHRDDKPGIFYPDHWGLFGGAIEPGEDPETLPSPAEVAAKILPLASPALAETGKLFDVREGRFKGYTQPA